MQHAWMPIRAVTNGNFLSATWLETLVARSEWLFGAAHSRCGLFFQRTYQSTNPGLATIWEGETAWHGSDGGHTALRLSARLNLDAAGTARLQIYDGAWADLATSTTDGDHWFGGSEYAEYDLSSGYTFADGIVRVRLTVEGGSGSSGIVYYAHLGNFVPVTSWPGAVPTFADGGGNEPDEDDFNALRSMQEYLYEAALHPQQSSWIATSSHTQEAAYEPLFRWMFRYSGLQRLYVQFTTTSMDAGDHVYLYLQDVNYPYGSSGAVRLATLADVTTDTTTSLSVDLSAEGLTVGGRYSIELGALDGPIVAVERLLLVDLAGGATRTYTPDGTWAEGDQPTAAALNLIADDLDEMYPAADRESPIWYEHQLTTYAPPASLGSRGPVFTSSRYRHTHRWRYLHWRGAGRLVSSDGVNHQSLSDTTTPGEAQTLDLESVRWLDYGQEYIVESFGSGTILVAYEDYI